MRRDRSNSPSPPIDGSAPGDVANQVRTAPAGDLPAQPLQRPCSNTPRLQNRQCRATAPTPRLDGSAPQRRGQSGPHLSPRGPGGKRSRNPGDSVFAIGIHFLVVLGLLLYHLILPRQRPRFPNALDRERRGSKGCQCVFIFFWRRCQQRQCQRIFVQFPRIIN